MTTQSRAMWSPEAGGGEYAQWNSRKRGVCVVGAMQTHTANGKPLAMIAPMPTVWAHAHKVTKSPATPPPPAETPIAVPRGSCTCCLVLL